MTIGGDAIGRNVQFQVAHKSVMPCKHYTAIRAKPSEYQAPGAQMLQENVKWCLIKSRVLGLEDKVIVRFRRELLYEWAASNAWSQAVLKQLGKIGLPPPEIVVHVNSRNAG